jgi:hypothetical protein
LVLTFHRTAQGYKMRCPSCGAVVRLRAEPKRRKQSADEGSRPEPPAPDEFDVELVPLPDLSAERPAQPRRGAGLLVAGGAAVLLLLVVAAGAVWWFLQ